MNSDKLRTVSFGIVDGEAIFMDVRTDTYFCVESADQRYLIDVQECSPFPRSQALHRILNLEDEPVEIILASCVSPAGSLLDEATPFRINPIDIFRATQLVQDTRSLLRARSLEAVLNEVVGSAPTILEASRANEDLIAHARKFLSVRKFVLAKNSCLLDSLSLLRWLGSQRQGLALVFGVKLHPFGAHCWVQADDLILNDRLDTVTAFTPVRVARCSDVTQ